ncbi:MAG: winged helix-turn-helix domain-containing protein [Armatimonadetes bacterium]|nr:winged helix-turn-helix domain-containing protein [Armatimonadota bacterium]
MRGHDPSSGFGSSGDFVLPWRIEMLGGLRARHSDIVVQKFQTQKTGALLAYLALEIGKTVPRDKLASLIWSDGDTVALRNRLNQAVSSLRRQLEAPGSGVGRVFISDHQVLGLDPNSVSSDVVEFETQIEKAQSMPKGADKLKALETAASLYRGELLEGIQEPWVLPKRTHYAADIRQVLHELIRENADMGRFAQAADFANRLVELEPGDEQAHLDLITMLANAGRHQAALRHFSIMEVALRERGSAPSKASLVLRSKITSIPSPAAYVPSTVKVEPLEPLPPKRPTATKRRIPVSFNRMIDREEEMSAVYRLLTEDDTRVVTVVGIGGSGKSRLAIELANQLLPSFEDSVYFVPCSPLGQAPTAIEQIGAVVAPGTPSDRRTFVSIREDLETVGRALLVLDSAEHLQESDLDELAVLISELPDLRVLVTSRRALHLPGETQFALGPLAVPSNVLDPADEVAKNPSVMLFVQRAQAVKPDFHVTERTGEAIARLCVRLEGLPLSLELAASWIRSLTPAQMLERLSQRLDFLESRRRDISQRHRTIRAVLDSTIGLLTPELRAAFFRMCVFSDGFDHDAVSQICPDCDADDLLDSLQEAGIVQRTTNHGDRARFTILETLIDYAREQASPDQQEEVGWLHADYFLEVAEGTAVSKRQNRDRWFTAVHADYMNLLSAMNWFFVHDEPEKVARIAIAMVEFWEASSRIMEGVHALESILDALGSDSPYRGRCATGLARLTNYFGNRSIYQAMSEQALEKARSAGDGLAVCEALLVVQQAAHTERDFDLSDRLALEGLETALALKDYSIASRWHLRLGNTAMERKQFDRARAEYEESLRLSRLAHDSFRVAATLVNIGMYGVETGQPELARLALSESLSLAKSVGAGLMFGTIVSNLVRVDLMVHRPVEALAWVAEAMRFKIELRVVKSELYLEVAEAAIQLGDPDLAAQLFGKSEEVQSTGMRSHIEESYFEFVKSGIVTALGTERFSQQALFGRQLSDEAADQLVNRLIEAHLPSVQVAATPS